MLVVLLERGRDGAMVFLNERAADRKPFVITGAPNRAPMRGSRAWTRTRHRRWVCRALYHTVEWRNNRTLAFDLGAESGRAMLARVRAGTVRLEGTPSFREYPSGGGRDADAGMLTVCGGRCATPFRSWRYPVVRIAVPMRGAWTYALLGLMGSSWKILTITRQAKRRGDDRRARHLPVKKFMPHRRAVDADQHPLSAVRRDSEDALAMSTRAARFVMLPDLFN